MAIFWREKKHFGEMREILERPDMLVGNENNWRDDET